jgi:spectrin beta
LPAITQRRNMFSESSEFVKIPLFYSKLNDFAFRLVNGGEFLLQAHDDSEMQQWVGSLKAQCDQTGAESRSQTLPASSQKDEPKRRSFFTLKKK